MPATPPDLPIEPVLPDLARALRGAGRVVLRAPPGSGKTTRVPEVVLDLGLPGQALLLEPRRVAARAAARYLAQRRKERVGETVGLQVRFERQVSARTRLSVITEGILSSRLVKDPLIEDVSCVILDEFHERSVHTDLALAFLRETLEVRDDLKIVVMSATLDPGPVARFLDAEVLSAEGRPYPVDVEYAEGRDERRLEDRVAAGVRRMLKEEPAGHVLAFLPGAPEVKRTIERLEGLLDVEVLPLFGALTSAEQDRIFTPGGGRRVIVSTNLAESSVTIDGVRAVVDSGLEKRVRFDTRRDVEVLETVRISRFSAEQRAGRAGRTGPGRVLRLWSSSEQARLHEQAPPEIERSDPVPTLLAALAFHPGDPSGLALLTPLPPALAARGVALLEMLGLVEDFTLTPRGQQAVELPVHPRQAVLLAEGAARGCLVEAALAAALLDERDVVQRDVETPRGESDLAWRLELIEDAEREGLTGAALRQRRLDGGRVRQVLRGRDQLLRLGRKLEAGPPSADPGASLREALLAAFPDRLCARRPGGQGAVMAAGSGVRLREGSGAEGADWFLALDVGGATGRSGDLPVGMAEVVDLADVEAVLGARMRTVERAWLDPASGRVKGIRERRLGELVLERKEGVEVGAPAIEAALLEAARERWDRLFRPDEDTQRLIDRLRFAQRTFPDEEWPNVAPEALLQLLPDLVGGLRTLDAVQGVDWASAIRGLLPWERQQALEEVAPERIEVPSGSQVRLDYGAAAAGEGPPVLAVRMQEMFGSTTTPRVARGRLPVLLHLLAPNMRPAQITDDLGGFWERTWAEVKKELRRRYPKHSWPDDPAHAEAERRPKRRPPK